MARVGAMRGRSIGRSAAQGAGRNIVLSGEIGEIVELAFNFLDARLQDGKGRRRRHSQTRLVHGDPWLRNAILSERQRLLQLLQAGPARVGRGWKMGGSTRTP